MSARDALAAIRRRAASPWNITDIGVMRDADVPALVEALEAVLDQADRWDRLANLDGTKDDAGWRMQVKAKQVREAIEAALGDR